MPIEPVRLLGCYGLFNCINADLDKCTDDIVNSNFTGIYVFLMNAWTVVKKQPLKKNPPMQPWKFLPAMGKFDLTIDNEDYYERLDEFTRTCGEKGLDMGISLDDSYCESKWASKFNFPAHPYRNNNAGINWGNNVRALYNSIEFGNPIKYHWLHWDIISEAQLKFKFQMVELIGAAREHYVDRVFAIIGKYLNARKPGGALKYPKFRVLWKSANEERAVRIFNSTTGQWTSSAVMSFRDRSEPYVWMTQIAKKNGCVAGPRFMPIVNRDIAQDQDEADYFKSYNQLYVSVTRPYGVSHGLGARLEVHLKSLQQAKDLIAKSGLQPAKTVFSSDGGTPELGAQFVKEGYPFVDVLYEEAVPTNPNPGKPWEWQKNWDKAFPYHAKLLENI